jgi:glucokinase
MLDLERISLGGAVFWHNRELLLPKLRAQLAGRFPALTEGVELSPAGLGLQVGEYGALALVA